MNIIAIDPGEVFNGVAILVGDQLFFDIVLLDNSKQLANYQLIRQTVEKYLEKYDPEILIIENFVNFRSWRNKANKPFRTAEILAIWEAEFNRFGIPIIRQTPALMKGRWGDNADRLNAIGITVSVLRSPLLLRHKKHVFDALKHLLSYLYSLNNRLYYHDKKLSIIKK